MSLRDKYRKFPNKSRSRLQAAPNCQIYTIQAALYYKPHHHSGKKVQIFVHIYQNTSWFCVGRDILIFSVNFHPPKSASFLINMNKNQHFFPTVAMRLIIESGLYCIDLAEIIEIVLFLACAKCARSNNHFFVLRCDVFSP